MQGWKLPYRDQKVGRAYLSLVWDRRYNSRGDSALGGWMGHRGEKREMEVVDEDGNDHRIEDGQRQ
ncbi:hypothetical protein TPAR_06286 [Tolypocladium paradoxum]|uniref:Uncharacterized protein n=1 Tax=Tolypocladium paradoxum TaxID=94208 RepID=A0A2S4KTK7_9HYPO|nr:hypothetical protein TPAR_06286 [Tolypocladium paradoxum]